MELKIITAEFNLNDLQDINCYQFCTATENNKEIKINIYNDKITNFINCLYLQYFKFDMLYQNNALIQNKTHIIEARMQHIMRKKTMISIILTSINEHPNFDVNILND